MQSPRIYLDHAATSWPKLPEAVEAAVEFMRECGATTGRGAYRSAQLAERWLSDARRAIANQINAANADSVAFCNSGTHALNAAFQGLLSTGDHVVTTAIEHNSVLRPLAQLHRSQHIELDIAPADANGWVDPQAVKDLITPQTRMVAIGHASNVTGTVQPVADIAQLANAVGAITLVDASQTLGYLPIDMRQMGIDVLAAAGHKGLRALAGTAILAVTPQFQKELKALMFGGTGNRSEQIDALPVWPQTVEVGNLNLPGIVSLAVAAERADLNRPWLPLLLKLRDGLQALPGAKLLGAAAPLESIPVASLAVSGWDHHDLANILDASFGIETRAGLHCAALIHNFLGSASSGGTLRISLGHSSVDADVDAVLEALRTILDS